MRASVDPAGRSLSQYSQLGRISNAMLASLRVRSLLRSLAEESAGENDKEALSPATSAASGFVGRWYELFTSFKMEQSEVVLVGRDRPFVGDRGSHELGWIYGLFVGGSMDLGDCRGLVVRAAGVGVGDCCDRRIRRRHAADDRGL